MTATNGRNPLYEQMMRSEGQTLVLRADREPEAVVRGGAREVQATISGEAFEELVQGFRTWLGTRLLRHVERTGRGSYHVEVEVTVDTAALPLEPGGEPAGRVQLQVINGRARLSALGG